MFIIIGIIITSKTGALSSSLTTTFQKGDAETFYNHYNNETMIYLGQIGSTKPEFHWAFRWTWGKQRNYKDGKDYMLADYRLEEDNVKSSLPWVRPSPAVSCFLLLGLDSHPAMQRHNKHTLLWQLGTILSCIAIEHTAWNSHFFRCMPIFVQFEILKFLKLKAKAFLQSVRILQMHIASSTVICKHILQWPP